MATAQLRTNVHRIYDRIIDPVAKISEAKWLATDLEIVCSNEFGGTLIYDFNFSVPTAVQITHKGDAFGPAGYASIENGSQIQGKQSRYLRVLNGDKINFRAVVDGNLNRFVIGEV